MVEISFFGDHKCSLGESPLWDAAASRLWWVDSRERRICAAGLDAKLQVAWSYEQMVGSIGLAEGGLIAGLADGFYAIDGASGEASLLARVPTQNGTVRLNDGKMDRQGRYFSGQTQMEEGASGSLWQLSAPTSMNEIRQGIRIANAICFSPNGDSLYFADSLDGYIRRHAYCGRSGEVGEQLGVIDVRPFGQAPDGATVDSEGNLWISLVLDQAVACFSPEGKLLVRIDVPIPFPSCPAFGGPRLDKLFLTSIGNSGQRLVTDHADGGRIIVLEGTGARGVAEARFRLQDHIWE